MRNLLSKRGNIIFIVLLALGLVFAVILSQQRQQLQSKASHTQTIAGIWLDYSTEVMEKSELPMHMSALAYDTNGQPIYEDIAYSWGISSSVSLGRLIETNHNIAGFQPLNVGSGDIFVTAIKGGQQVTKSFKMTVVDSFTTTPPPGSYTFITFNALLHGRGRGGDNANPNSIGNLNPKHKEVPFTVSFYDNADTYVGATSGDLIYDNATGKYSGYIFTPSYLPVGLYTLKVETNNFLRRQIPGFYLIEPNRQYVTNTFSLIAGDTYPDNRLDILDYNRILGCYADIAPAINCNDDLKAQSDINDDGFVNHIDYNLFIREVSVQEGQ